MQNVVHHYRLAACGLLSLLAIWGCRKPDPVQPPNSTAQVPLRVIVVDDAPLAATMQREWLAHTENQLEVASVTAEQAATAQQLPADVVIYPPGLVGQFAASDLILPLDEQQLSTPEFARDDIDPLLRSQLTTWGRRTVAVPLGSPQLVLFYRADLLAQHKLEPPQTWEEYQALVDKFQAKPAEVTTADDNWQATAEPLAAGWAAELLLARAASAAVHRDQLSPLFTLENCDPLITGPPWVRACEQLVAAHSKAGDTLLTPADCYAKFQAGECALAITWPMLLTEAPPSMLKPEQIGLALLPGSREMFNPESQAWESLRDGESLHVPVLGSSGKLASVTRASPQPRAATQFLLWLSGPRMSGRIAAHSAETTPFRTSHFRDAGPWQPPQPVALLPQYGELLLAEQSQPRRLISPRIPGRKEYLAALDRAVLAAVMKETSPTDALTTAGDEWQKITATRGADSQQRALRRSLGLID
ncbi:Bacterial extracellular solute-binding protein [Anatilimnocola aggregata]|uniref:Bacterial extracellular solute-binding protein n=1 Tax=Anatilimnocola aggregata TaxID=2528021 RepID=A0A517YMQ3_9BACT|nr:extracellular solute-binding protein [Anatilimnocola aggregata]QDU31508.1 Bacterial extracellular solute-binding protein [Anatilimnocola aggregata]